MKNLFIIIILLAQFSCGKSSCELIIEELVTTRSRYRGNPSDGNCENFRNLITRYLQNPCVVNEQINYQAIFARDLSSLPCYEFNSIEDPCIISLNDLLDAGERYNGSGTVSDCQGYKEAIESYISSSCLNFEQYESTLQGLPCF